MSCSKVSEKSPGCTPGQRLGRPTALGCQLGTSSGLSLSTSPCHAGHSSGYPDVSCLGAGPWARVSPTFSIPLSSPLSLSFSFPSIFLPHPPSPFPPPSFALCPFSAFPTSGIVSHSVMCLSSLSFSVSIFLLLFPSPSLSPSVSSLCRHPWNKTEPQNPRSTRTCGTELFKP